MIIIADTAPLNYLIQIGEVSVLAQLYGHVVIPSAVQTELLDTGAPAEVRGWIAEPPDWLEIRSLDQAPTAISPKLDAGEIEAIALAEILHADLLIVDDMPARREAERRGLPIIGTLGVLREAAFEGLLDLPSAVARLRRTNFHVSAELLEKLLGSTK
jgi:predicted nucleic acid-binding protein